MSWCTGTTTGYPRLPIRTPRECHEMCPINSIVKLILIIIESTSVPGSNSGHSSTHPHDSWLHHRAAHHPEPRATSKSGYTHSKLNAFESRQKRLNGSINILGANLLNSITEIMILYYRVPVYLHPIGWAIAWWTKRTRRSFQLSIKPQPHTNITFFWTNFMISMLSDVEQIYCSLPASRDDADTPNAERIKKKL